MPGLAGARRQFHLEPGVVVFDLEVAVGNPDHH
jgi:hypothetical protein